MAARKRSILRTTNNILTGTGKVVSDTVHWGLFGIGAVAAVAKVGWDEAKRGYTKADELLSSADPDVREGLDEPKTLDEHHRS